jgi:glycosyltransferase involved in cell wall biosynthesis
VIASARPEAIFVWNLLRLTVGPVRAAQASGLPIWFAFNDENIASYRPVPFAPSPRRLMGWLIDRLVVPQITLRGLDFSRSTCISAQLKSKLLDARVPVERAHVIYQGIPVERFPAKARRPFERPVKVLFAGQLVPSKGIPTLLEAANRIAKEDPDALEVSVAGAGPSEQALRAQAAGPARVRFLGKVSHEAMPALYRQHDVFVFPSSGPEAFGLTHLEAMASGTPVVSTATGGQGEFLRDGENALVFSPGDAAGLMSCLLRLFNDPPLAARLSAAARAQVVRDFSLERYVAQLERLIVPGSSQLETRRAHAS